MLDVIGLSPLDLRVYGALVDSRSMTTAELADELGLSMQRLSQVLRGLTAKHLVIRAPGRPVRFTAVAPDVGLGALVLLKEQELESARLVANRFQDRHRHAVGRQASDLIEVVRGSEAIARRADQIMRSARHEVRFVDKPPYAKAPAALHPAERDLLGAGIRFRGVYDRGALELHDLYADLEAGLRLGEEARVTAEAPLKMIVADHHLALVPLHSNAPTVEIALVVHPSTLLDALGALFQNLWRHSLPLCLPGSPHTTHNALSTEDSRLLALLTTGLPDRSIAKQLGLSYRTFQRRLRELMDFLGAQTRFQAGLQAAARGWVTVPVPQPPPSSRGRMPAEPSA